MENERANLTAQALLTANDLQMMGFPRTRAYQLLNRHDLPVVKIGGRKFMHKRLFEVWLEEQAQSGTVCGDSDQKGESA